MDQGQSELFITWKKYNIVVNVEEIVDSFTYSLKIVECTDAVYFKVYTVLKLLLLYMFFTQWTIYSDLDL